MFAQTEDTVIGAVIAVINRDRNGERIDNALLKNVINSFGSFLPPMLHHHEDVISLQ